MHFRGTPIYAAPELLTNVHAEDVQSCSRISKPSRKSDMYAFAILTWEFITEKKPFDDIINPVMLCSRVHQGYRPSLNDIPRDYTDKLKYMISSTWDGDRIQRKSAIECFQLLKFYYDLMSNISYDIYLLNHKKDQNIAKLMWQRLIQNGLNVVQCNEMTSDGVMKAKVVVVCLTKEFQKNPECVYEVKFARDLSPKRLVVPVILEAKADEWVDDDMYYYFQMRDKSVTAFDISHIMTADSKHDCTTSDNPCSNNNLTTGNDKNAGDFTTCNEYTSMPSEYDDMDDIDSVNVSDLNIEMDKLTLYLNKKIDQM